MDNTIQQLQYLQDKVILYRKNTLKLKDVMKQTYTQELQQLLNVEMKILETQLKIPEQKTPLPKVAKQQIVDTDEIRNKIENCKCFLHAMAVLK